MFPSRKKKSGRIILPPPNKPLNKAVSEKKTTQKAETPEVKRQEITTPAPEKPKEEKTPKKAKTTSSIGLGLSLKAMLNDEEETSTEAGNSTEEVSTEGIGSDSLSQESVEKAWLEYTKLVIEEGNNSYATTLKLTKPELSTQNKEEVNCILLNSLQLKQFNEQKQGLLNYLRKTLNNKNIQVEASEAESNDKRMLYTDGEKLRALAESNPNIKLLIDKLGLETEF